MKLAVRVFAALVVLAGAAASFSSAPSQVAPSHQTVTASLPVPTCGPGMPWCGNTVVAR